MLARQTGPRPSMGYRKHSATETKLKCYIQLSDHEVAAEFSVPSTNNGRIELRFRCTSPLPSLTDANFHPTFRAQASALLQAHSPSK